LLPDNPLLIVGQTSAVDPSRAPDNQHVLWIQVRALPSQIKGDVLGEIQGTDWDEIKEAYADRVITKLEKYVPGLRDLILERVVYSPLDLERQNPNLHGGDSVSGSHHLRQNFIYRPIAGWSDYTTPLKNLYMVGAATWPGAGTNAISGYLAAQKILQPSGVVTVLQQGGEMLGSTVGSVASSVIKTARSKLGLSSTPSGSDAGPNAR
jgi:phytoene dehydrogenase-like protein